MKGYSAIPNVAVQGVPSDSEQNAISNPPLARTRLIMASRCSSTVTLGEFTIPCPCNAGIFTISLETLTDFACQRCTHHLSKHGDVTPAFEGMASFRSIQSFL